MKLLELTIPEYLLPALFNGDTSNLDDDEARTLGAWVAERTERHGFFYATGWKGAGFFANNDFDGLAGDCQEGTFHVGRYNQDDPFVSRGAEETLLKIAHTVREAVNQIQELPDDVYMSSTATTVLELSDKLVALLEDMAWLE